MEKPTTVSDLKKFELTTGLTTEQMLMKCFSYVAPKIKGVLVYPENNSLPEYANSNERYNILDIAYRVTPHKAKFKLERENIYSLVLPETTLPFTEYVVKLYAAIKFSSKDFTVKMIKS